MSSRRRQCFACSDDSLLDGKQPEHLQHWTNQKFSLRCCGRRVCSECLGAFGRRCSARVHNITKQRRPSLHDVYSDEMNKWLDFCRSRDYTQYSRCKFARVPTTQCPPKCSVVQDLRPEYKDLKCPFCARKKQASKSLSKTYGSSHPSTSSDGLPPLPKVLADEIVDVRFRHLGVDGKGRYKRVKVRVVELAAVVNMTTREKGKHAEFSVVSDSNRYLKPKSNVEWTLVWSKHKSGTSTAADDDDQVLSLLHHGGLAEITDEI